MKRTVITFVVGFGIVMAGAVQTTLRGKPHAKLAGRNVAVQIR